MSRLLILATALFSLSGLAGAYAQGVAATPDTNVRSLETPSDVRGKQLRAQDKPMTEEGRSTYQSTPGGVAPGEAAGTPAR
jgi:hypothetical protein